MVEMILLRIGVNIFVPGFNFMQKIFPHKRIRKKIDDAFWGNSCNTQLVPDLVISFPCKGKNIVSHPHSYQSSAGDGIDYSGCYLRRRIAVIVINDQKPFSFFLEIIRKKCSADSLSYDQYIQLHKTKIVRAMQAD